MRCTNCEYRLWHITSRQCPECGQPFKPSDFEFVLNSVQFCCPHCDQPYYGTGEQGHLIPTEFDCVQCSQHIHMDDMVLRPADHVTERETQVDINPWLDRKERGFFNAWFTMIGWAMVDPNRQIKSTKVDSPVSQAIWYLMFTAIIFSIFGKALILVGIMLPAFSAARTAGGGGDIITVISAILGSLIIPPIFVLLSTTIWAFTTHILLVIFGQTRHDFFQTFRCFCYSYGANVFTATPCIGFHLSFFSWIWWAISAIIMICESQKTSGLRTSFAVFAYPIIIMAIMAGGVVYAVHTASNSVNTAMSTMSTSSAQILGDGLIDYANDHMGGFPENAALLVTDDYLQPTDFITFSAGSNSQDTFLSDMDMLDFQIMDHYEQTEEIEKLISTYPDNIIAHRVGSYVFTYHNLNTNTADPNLWIAIQCPMQFTQPNRQPYHKYVAVVHVDGVITSYLQEDFPTALQEQNDLRLKNNLLPIPDPQAITFEHPTAP